MNRRETTKFLSDLLVKDRFNGIGKYWAREVSIDYGTTDVKRVDFMEFQPTGVVSISEIEKGIFVCYEVKSCMADYKSGFGQNFLTEKNYLVMPAELCEKVMHEIPRGIGVICPIPLEKGIAEELENPTPLDEECIQWKMRVILPAYTRKRKRSMVELLFCMLRSGK